MNGMDWWKTHLTVNGKTHWCVFVLNPVPFTHLTQCVFLLKHMVFDESRPCHSFNSEKTHRLVINPVPWSLIDERQKHTVWIDERRCVFFVKWVNGMDWWKTMCFCVKWVNGMDWWKTVCFCVKWVNGMDWWKTVCFCVERHEWMVWIDERRCVFCVTRVNGMDWWKTVCFLC